MNDNKKENKKSNNTAENTENTEDNEVTAAVPKTGDEENNTASKSAENAENAGEKAEITPAAQDDAQIKGKKKKKKKHGFWRVFGYVIAIIIAVIVIGVIIYGILRILFPSNNNVSTPVYSEAVDLNDEQIEFMSHYIDAVNATKEEENFDLAVSTATEIGDIECSMSMFQTIINAMMSSMDTDMSSDETYSFKDGKDGDNTPMAVVQPGYADIPDGSYGGIAAVTGTNAGDSETIEFTVAAESMNFEEMMSIMGFDDMTAEEQEAMMNGDGTDYSENMDEMRDSEEYQTFMSMVPNHMNYFDVTSAFSTMMGSFSFGDDEDEDMDMSSFFGDDAEMDSDSSMMDMMNGGTFTFGDMQFTATLNDGLLQSVSIELPINVEISFNMLGRDIDIAYTIAISQDYTFTF